MRQLLPVPSSGPVGAEDVDLVALYGRSTPRTADFPAVRVNMVASVDGAASAGGLSGGLGGRADRNLFAILRSLADVVLVGSSTFRAENYRPALLGDAARQRRIEAGMTVVPPIAVLTGACRLDWSSSFFTEAVERPLVITVSASDPDDRARAADVADVVLAGTDRVDVVAALRALGRRGCTNVLAEGGPSIIGQLASVGHVDELCLTLSPRLLGGAAGRIITGPGLDPAQGLDLCSVVEADDFLFLRYQRRDSDV